MFRSIMIIAFAAGAAYGEAIMPLTPSADWSTFAPEDGNAEFRTEEMSRSGDAGLVIDVPEGEEDFFYQYHLPISDITEGELYELTGWVKIENHEGEVGAMLSLGAFNDQGERFLDFNSQRLRGNTDWTFLECIMFIDPEIESIAPTLILHEPGTAYFDEVKLTQLDDLDGAGAEATLTAQIASRPHQEDFLGFGLEDDYFFFTEENFRHGVDEEDIQLRKERIAELDPSIIATLIWWDAFNPTRDLKILDTESEQMEAFYRTLKPHQEAGRAVILADVHWGWAPEQFPYNKENLEKGTRFYADFLIHLVKDKGFTCIRFASISGEIDLHFELMGGTFETYVRATQLLRKHLDEAGLTDIRLIGDKVTGVSWFEQVVKHTDPYVGLYTTHEYPDVTQYPIIQTRLERMMEVIHAHSEPLAFTEQGAIHKPAFLWEIGYFDRAEGDHDGDHQAVRRFDYGLLCAHTALTSLNLGFAGGSVWCLHSMYYPGQNYMDFGFWEFKHTDWQIRPFYYGYGLLTRFAGADMTPVPVTLTPQYHDVTVAAVKNEGDDYAVFLLNLSDHTVAVTVDGLPDKDYSVYAYVEERIPEPGDENYGRIDALATGKTWSPSEGAFSIPPQALIALR